MLRKVGACGFAIVLALASCRSANDPSPHEPDVADSGPQPDLMAAQSACIPFMLLVDSLMTPDAPGTPQVSFGSMRTGWFRADGDNRKPRAAWVLPAEKSVIDDQGARSEIVPWEFFFSGDQLIGVGHGFPGSGGAMSYTAYGSDD